MSPLLALAFALLVLAGHTAAHTAGDGDCEAGPGNAWDCLHAWSPDVGAHQCVYHPLEGQCWT